MGDVVLASVLRYLNGNLFENEYSKFATFFVTNYSKIPDFSLADIERESGVSKDIILQFLNRLQFKNYQEFHDKLIQDMILRNDQIGARMMAINSHDFLDTMEIRKPKKEFLDKIAYICNEIKKADRIILMGALYPMSLSVELQTDLITFGKNVIQCVPRDTELCITENDFIIFVSATGRAIENFLQSSRVESLENSNSLLITQNPKYLENENRITNKVIKVPGKYDGLYFNYQIMTIFDLLRVHYYQRYYRD